MNNQNESQYEATVQKLLGAVGKDQPEERLRYLAWGVLMEACELGDLVKKVHWHGHPINQDYLDTLADEAGDALWYTVNLMAEYGDSLERWESAWKTIHASAEFWVARDMTTFWAVSELISSASMIFDYEHHNRFVHDMDEIVNAYEYMLTMIAVVAIGAGRTIGAIADLNLEKLGKRHPGFNFTTVSSIARVDQT